MDSYRIAWSVTAVLIASGPDLESRVVAPVQQCYFWQETPEFPRHYELEHCHDEAAMTSFPTVLFSLRHRKMFL